MRILREAWGKWKAGSRIRDAFDRVVDNLTRSTVLRDDQSFLKFHTCQVDTVRTPTDEPDSRREVKYVPAEELHLAIQRLVADAHVITPDELSMRIARLFGWQRRGPDIQAALDDAVYALVETGALTAEGDHLAIR